MPRGDETGPPAIRKEIGGGSGSWEQRPGSGPGGECVCLECQKVLPHRRGQPCNKIKCPDCGRVMTRRI